MVMAAGVPGLFYMQQIFWAFVGTALGVAVLINTFNIVLYHQRMAASRAMPDAARPKSLVFKAQASIAAVIREFSYYSMPLKYGRWNFYLPPAGPVTMMVGYIVLITVCCLYRLNPKDFLQWEDIGYRSGFIAIAQLPLIVLLSSKRNYIGFFTGMGYERLNWLHRWTARALLFTVLIHFGYWMSEWGKFDYISTKLREDVLTQRGIAAGAILLWLTISSILPLRSLSYEFFVVQHVISYLGFLVALYFHVPEENRVWIWIPLAFWACDRFARALYMLYNNLAILHHKSSGLLSSRATFEPLDDSHTRITIRNPPITWQAGQHVFLACHPLAPLTSHPFTIASLPADGKMEFIVRAKKGATRRFFNYAEKMYPSLPSSSQHKADRGVLIDGPYSRIRPLRQFDSVLFIAGSTGATFTVPLMRDIVQHWNTRGSGSASRFSLEPAPGAVTRHVKFIWCLKRQVSIDWFSAQLSRVVADVEALRNKGHDIAVEISIYVTCDETMTSERSSLAEDGADGRGVVQQISRSSIPDEKGISEKAVAVSSRRSSIQKCCCTKIVEEGELTAPCCCENKLQQVSSASSAPEKSSRLVDARIQLISGRPNISNIIRKTAELALGEMAVVVCGPPGLVQCTRNSVVAISDERAVHKGTGAQGIYVHAEAFGYA